MQREKTVDAYIDNSARWQDELRQLRAILQATGLKEEIKWGAPCYTCNGQNVVGMASFKSYFGLWFHQGALLKDEAGMLINAQEGKTRGLRQWRMQSAKDIRPGVIRRYLTEAVRLAESGRKIVPVKKTLEMPAELSAALKEDAAIKQAYESLTAGRQKEYADYVASAKLQKTRLSRVDKVLPMIAAGKGLNDKYRRS